jgi:hypothetical protein
MAGPNTTSFAWLGDLGGCRVWGGPAEQTTVRASGELPLAAVRMMGVLGRTLDG